MHGKSPERKLRVFSFAAHEAERNLPAALHIETVQLNIHMIFRNYPPNKGKWVNVILFKESNCLAI
jgi:hypothetical protein